MRHGTQEKQMRYKMKFTIVKHDSEPCRDKFTDFIADKCIQHGHEYCPDSEDLNFVFNLTNLQNPLPYRRKSKSLLVVSIVSDVSGFLTNHHKSRYYTALIQSLSNLFISVVPKPDNSQEIYFLTPEAGFYHTKFAADEVYQKIHPIISSHLATDNNFSTDLPERCYSTTPIIEEIKYYSKLLSSMGVLPTPFPLSEVLSEEALNHLFKIFGISGASYGNISSKESIPELGDFTFWMTGRGVNKSNLRLVGQDILLVKGIDASLGSVQVSVPQKYNPRARVSVDAYEHALIYKAYPETKAIVHVHAWMDGIQSTHQNYPCGTIELAEEVLELLAKTENPSQCVIGLKNHGISITGHSLSDIFARITGKLKTEVEMYA